MPSAAIEPDFEALDALTDGSNKFAISLYQTLSRQNGNVIVSPVSLQLVLAMAHLGARGDTAAEITKTLGLPAANPELILKGHRSLIELLQLPVLNIANKLFIQEGLNLNSDFQSSAMKYFLSSVGGVPFSTDPEGARQQVNRWVEENTNKKIQDLLPTGSVDSLTRLVLTNAIHFKASWEHKFPPSGTMEEPFHLTPTQTVNVKMMHIKKRFGYKQHEFLKSQLVELPYEGGDMKMVIILPDELDGLAEVEQKLSTINLSEEFSKLSETTVSVSLPQFKIEQTMDLEDILKEMGIKTMFTDDADLSGLVENAPHLKVSKVIQKAFIDVTEEGTEAAAATGMMIATMSLSLNPYFICNHPFLYIIMHTKTSTPAFIGSVKRF